MHDRAHVRLVHPHPERVGGHHHPDVVVQEAPLHGRAPLTVEPGVVRKRLLAQFVGEPLGDLLRPRARARVDDRWQRVLAPQGLDEHGVLLMGRRPGDREREVGAVKSRRHP